MAENTTTFTTVSVKLEQFLYCHDIYFKSWRKNIDGMTEWTYIVTPELNETIEEYRKIAARRAERRKN